MPTVFLFLAALLITVPPFAIADAATVGFPANSVWLSKTDAVAGETVQIYVALYNANEKTFRGTLVFFIDNERVVEKEFALEAGVSSLESALWKASEGAHTMRAVIENPAGVPVASVAESSAVVAFAVAKPPMSPAATAVSKASDAVSSAASTVVPYVQSAIETVHRNIEPYRESAVAYLEDARKQQEKRRAEQSAEQDAVVAALGTSQTQSRNNAESTTPTVPNAYVEIAKNTWSTLSQVALAGALYAAKTPALFYALVLATIVGILWSLFRWALRRPF